MEISFERFSFVVGVFFLPDQIVVLLFGTHENLLAVLMVRKLDLERVRCGLIQFSNQRLIIRDLKVL
jgi:hypothetical protein